MRKVVQDYVSAKKNLLEYFSCKDDYPVVVLLKNKWEIHENEGMYFLACQTEEGEQLNYAVVKKDGEPLIYKTREHSMVIAIDCIKTAFVFKNNGI